MLDIDLEHKEALLAEVNVYRRAEMLLAHLADLAPGRMQSSSGGFPEFSAN